MFSRCILVACVTLASIGAAAADEPPALEHLQTWDVAGPGRFDASGLLLHDGKFLVVSDRHNETIFALAFEGATARAEPFITFSGPEPYPPNRHLDIEGIAPAPEGGFYLVSEWGFAPFLVPSAGGAARWVSPDLRATGGSVGLFATRDASLEGVTALPGGGLLLACERGPRGLIEVAGAGRPQRITVQNMDTSRYPAPGDRGVDWSDLTVWRDRVFGLARNQHLVVELHRARDGSWEEGAAWSFAAVENAPAHRFADMSFGQAEGLAIDDDRIYVLIDSNNQERVAQPGDKRTWLFAFRNPLRQ